MRCSTNLITRRISQIGNIHLHPRTFANTGRIFAVFTTCFNAGFMPGVHRFRTLRGKAEGEAVAVRRRFTINRIGNTEYAGRGTIKLATLRVMGGSSDPQSGQRRVIKFAGSFQVICSQNYMAEHVSLLLFSNSIRCSAMRQKRADIWRSQKLGPRGRPQFLNINSLDRHHQRA